MRIAAAALIAFLTAPAFAQTPPTAQQVIERIQNHVGIAWTTPTVDTFKAGDPNTPVTGIAVTMMATLDVLERAAASGNNLIITHEPTFYNPQDETAPLQRQSDTVLSEKEAFIRDHHLVIWRFHDHWHRRRPDGILLGMVHALGWEAFQNTAEPQLFTLPETTVADLAANLKRKLGVSVLRVVGDPEMKITKVAMLPGAAGSDSQEKLLERNDVQVLVIGETREWETVEYVADAVTEHKQKALIILSHIPSEQAGMEECARWLKTFITEVPIKFVATDQPFWAAR